MNSKQNNQTSRSALLIGAGLALAFTVTQASAQQLAKVQAVGAGIYEIVVEQESGAVYVASVGQSGKSGPYIYKLDPQTLTVQDSITLGEIPGFGLGINQKTKTLYTSNTRSNSVHAVDLKTGKILATITNGAESSHTREIVVDEISNLVYVSDVGDPSSIWVIDGKTQKYLYSLENAGKTATGLAVDAENNKLYVSVMGDNSVVVYDTKTRSKIASFPSGGESPMNLALDKAGKRLFATNYQSGELSVLNSVDGTLIQKVKVGANPIGVAFDSNHNMIYTANRQGNSVSAINGASYVVSELPTEGLANTVAIHEKTGKVYVTNKQVGTRVREGQTPPTPLKNGDKVVLIEPAKK